MKEKLVAWLGGFGLIIFYILELIISLFPIVMVVNSFDLPSWTNFVFIAITYFIPSTTNIFWIAGLVGAIIGPQDILAIIYYILFVIIISINLLVPLLIDIFGRDK